MCGLIKGTVRLGLITAVVGVAAVALAGPDRVMHLAGKARDKLNASIDRAIDDPTVMRAKLNRLQEQYPKRLATLERDLDDVRHQIREIEHELAIAKNVVSFADEDLQQLETLLTKADERRRDGGFGVVRVRFGEQTLTTRDAYAKATNIARLRDTYEGSIDRLTEDLDHLRQQERRLGELHAKLVAEELELQAQVWEIERRIDTYERNERLLAIMEERESRIREFDRYQAAGIGDFQSHMAALENQHARRFERLVGSELENSYESRARVRARSSAPGREARGEVIGLPEVIVEPEEEKPARERRSRAEASSVAGRG